MQSSGWTQMPNFIFDYMASMDKCEFYVVVLIARRTIGYQKEWDRISFNQFATDTGMNRNSIEKGIQAAVDRGIIERREVRNSFEYRIQCPENGTKNVPNAPKNGTENVPIDANSGTENVPNSSTENVLKNENGTENKPKLVQKISIQKKKEKTNTSSSEDANVLPDGKKENTEHQKMFEKICDIVGWDYRTLDEKSKGQIAQTLGFLKKGNYTLEDLNRFGAKVWVHDWRREKNKQRPNLTQLRQEIGKLRAKAFKANGNNAPNGQVNWGAAFDNLDVPDYIKQMRGAV